MHNINSLLGDEASQATHLCDNWPEPAAANVHDNAKLLKFALQMPPGNGTKQKQFESIPIKAFTHFDQLSLSTPD